MKRKIISSFLAVLFLCLIFNVKTTYAATCPPHSNYQDVVKYTSYSNSTHKVYLDYWVDGQQVYRICKILTESKTHFIYCGECQTQVGYYPENISYHSINH